MANCGYRDEYENKIVKRRDAAVYIPLSPEGRGGVLKRIDDGISKFTFFIAKGDRIVATSSNITYTGNDSERIKDAMKSAVTSVLEKGEGMVMVQYQKIPRSKERKDRWHQWRFWLKKNFYSISTTECDYSFDDEEEYNEALNADSN